MYASRAAVFLCARAVGATGLAFSCAAGVCVCADAAEWRALLLGAELPVNSRCHSAAAASSRRHIRCSCFDVTAAGADACRRLGRLHGLSHYHVHACQLLSTATACVLVGIPQTHVA